VLALWSLSFRYRSESRNLAVGLCLEADVVASFAAAQGQTLAEALRDLRAHGLGGLVVSETTIAELVQRGEIEMRSGPTLLGPVAVIERIYPFLESRFPGVPPRSGSGSRGWVFLPNVDPKTLLATSVGIDMEVARNAREADLFIVARHTNVAGLTWSAIRQLLTSSRDRGAQYFLPEGDSVPGQRALTKELAAFLPTLPMRFAQPEFAKIAGVGTMSEANPENVVPLHAIQALEIERMTMAQVVERFGKAVRERGVRLLLVRPLTLAAERPTDSCGELIAALNREVTRVGATLAPPHPYEPPGVPAWLFVCIGLAGVPAAAWCLFSPLNSIPLRILGAGVCLIAGGAAILESGRWIPALLFAFAFPIGGYLYLLSRERVNVWRDYWVMAAWSLGGGVLVAGLLNDTAYLVRADQFVGVKAAHFGPILVVLWILLRSVGSPREILSQPVYWSGIVAAVVLIAGLGLMWMRTGNDNPAAVSDWELQFRALADAILYVRPRTKEILLGHPALWLGICLLTMQQTASPSIARGGWVVGLLALGAIGQTSITNTLCHLHTPLVVGFSRIAVGLVLGSIIGVVLWAVVARGISRGRGEGP
jgi:hypothetical protein